VLPHPPFFSPLILVFRIILPQTAMKAHFLPARYKLHLVEQFVRIILICDTGGEVNFHAQDDTGGPIRLFLSDELVAHYVGINDDSLRSYDSSDSSGRMEILRNVIILR
jgi:hypothetical protein